MQIHHEEPVKDLNSMNSPLTSFVNMHSHNRQRNSSSSPTKVISPYKSVIPTRYDPRQSDDQLERLISQSKLNIVPNLLFDGDERVASHPPPFVDPSRPLTSAGRKLTSRGLY